MNFSEVEACSGLAAFSPGGDWLAIVKNARVTVWDAATGAVEGTFTTLDSPAAIEWAPDSGHLMCLMQKRNTIQVFSRSTFSSAAKLSICEVGVGWARWTPDSKRLITVLDTQLLLHVWSLVDGSMLAVRSPKYCDAGLDFTPDGNFMVLLEKQDTKDQIAVYSYHDLTLTKVLPTQTIPLETLSAEDLLCSRTGTCIIVWDCAAECGLWVYSLMGALIYKFQPYKLAMGVRTVVETNDGLSLAVVLYDQSVRVLTSPTWKEVCQLSNASPDCPIYQESESRTEGDYCNPSQIHVYFALLREPVKLQTAKNAKQGTSAAAICAWSNDGCFLATKSGIPHSDATPCAVHIWSLPAGTLVCILSLQQPVKSVSWSPRFPLLSVCTNSSRFYLWSAAGAAVCELPCDGFSVGKVRWSASGSSLLLADKGSVMLAYPQFAFD